MLNNFSPALKVALIYLTFSLIWIFTSDTLVASISDNKDTLNFLQTIKGWLFVTFTSLLIYLVTNKYLNIEKQLRQTLQDRSQELENIIQNSPVPTVVLNEDGKFLIINKIWLELTGYNFEDINTLEKWTQKAYKNNAKIKQDTILELFALNEINDNGEFIIRTKDDKEVTWHFYSSLLGIKNGKKQLIGTAIDVTELKNKNNLIIQQSKMAALGEMIENIAHQWRQPLSSISTISTGIELQEEYGKVPSQELIQSMKTINTNAQYLSNTINDFRNFFDKERLKKYFKSNMLIKKTIDLIKPRVVNHNIKIIKSIENVEIENYENELIQVLINIFNNAIDALKEQIIEERYIFISTKQSDENLVIEIKDNAGGIDEKLIGKIFDPYFTTKHKSQGTGIGLFMSEEIVSKHMKGSIEVHNSSFSYNEKEYKGANFIITLPLKI